MGDVAGDRISKPTRKVSRAESTYEASNQFKATHMWNRIAKEFREKMPTRKHRRQLRAFENSFTGKEATDFMLNTLPTLVLPNSKEITREGCITLLQKFADQGLFKYAWTVEKTVFLDNATLYVWNGDCTLNGLCRTPVLLRRASSFNNGSADRPRRPPMLTPKVPSIASPADTWKTFELPKSPPKHKPTKNRRLSSSTGNLSMIGVEKFEAIMSPRFIEQVTIVEEAMQSPERKNMITVDPERKNMITVDRESTIGRRESNHYAERKNEPIYVKHDKKEEDTVSGRPPTPSLVRSSPVYASFKKDEKAPDADKENNYEYVTFRRRNAVTPSKGNRRGGVQVARDKKDDDYAPMKSVIARLTPSRFKGKESDKEPSVSPVGPSTVYSSIQPTVSVSRRRDDAIYSSIRVRPRALVTEADEWTVYASVLGNRVRALLGNTESNIISWKVDGQHVRWSCKNHPAGGVVRAMKQTDDWPSSLVQQMRYLETFPFHSKHVSVITYTEQQELNVFKTVVAQMQQSAPLLPSDFGQACLQVIAHYKKISNANSSRPSSAGSGNVRYETAFSVGSPTTRLLPPQTSCTSLNTSKDDMYVTASTSMSSTTGRATIAGQIPYIDGPLPSILSHRHSANSTPPHAPLRVDPRSGIKARDILMEPLERERILRLPGLHQSPDVMERIMNLSPRGAAIPFSIDAPLRSRDRCSVAPALEGIAPEMEPALFETLQLLMLSLPVGTRRKLQSLIKFINKITTNHCLALQEGRENRYVALDAFCDSILASCDDYSLSTLSFSDRILIVSMLIDHESRLFSIPVDFESRVESVLAERRRSKMEFDDGSPDQAPPPPQYCQRVKPEVFNAQKKDTQESIRALLENIITSDKLSNSEREKKLKAFEKNYPEMYYMRFPERERRKPEGGFLSKIFRTRND